MLKVTEENIKYLFNLGMGKDYKRNTKAGNRNKKISRFGHIKIVCSHKQNYKENKKLTKVTLHMTADR